VNNQTFVSVVEKLHALYERGQEEDSFFTTALIELTQACHTPGYSITKSTFLATLANVYQSSVSPIRIIQFLDSEGWFAGCDKQGSVTFEPDVRLSVCALTAFDGSKVKLMPLDQVICFSV
jgi:hypothetical protein